MDIVKSFFTWVFNILFIVLMFPLTLILWLIGAPSGHSALLVRRWLAFQGRVMVGVSPLWKLKVTGRENLDRGRNYIIISNHQSLLDIPVMECLRDDYKWVSKIENFRVPILGQSMRLAGYISIKRGDKESVIRMMEQSERLLNRGESLFIFPEGTRSPDGEIKRFKSGAFRLALKTKTPIIPVLVDGTGAVLPRKGFIFSSGHKLVLKILKPIYPDDFNTTDPDQLAAKTGEMMKEQLECLRRDEGQKIK